MLSSHLANSKSLFLSILFHVDLLSPSRPCPSPAFPCTHIHTAKTVHKIISPLQCAPHLTNELKSSCRQGQNMVPLSLSALLVSNARGQLNKGLHHPEKKHIFFIFTDTVHLQNHVPGDDTCPRRCFLIHPKTLHGLAVSLAQLYASSVALY